MVSLQPFRVRFEAMASDNELQLFAPEGRAARDAAEVAIAEVRRIEAKYSRYRDDSVLTRINRNAGCGPVDIDPETAALLVYANACYEASDGRFDITSGVLRRAWDFRAGVVPTPAAVAAVLPLIGWGRVRRLASQVELTVAGMEIDFGGIGKEYAADRAAGVCMAAGIGHGLVNLGGDVRIIGPRPDGDPWRVGIRHPRDPDAVIATVSLTAGALATSGDYERFFVANGVRHCHILDPRSGRSVRHWQSVSVVAQACVSAGSYATIAMLLEADGRAMLNESGIDYLLVGPDGALSGPLAPSTA